MPRLCSTQSRVLKNDTSSWTVPELCLVGFLKLRPVLERRLGNVLTSPPRGAGNIHFFFPRSCEEACPSLRDFRLNIKPFRLQAEGRQVFSVIGPYDRERNVDPLSVTKASGHEPSYPQEPPFKPTFTWQSLTLEQEVVNDLVVLQL